MLNYLLYMTERNLLRLRAERERPLWEATVVKFAQAVIEKLPSAEQSQLMNEASQELDPEKVLQLAVSRAQEFKTELVALIQGLGEFSRGSLQVVHANQPSSLALNIDGEVVLKTNVVLGVSDGFKPQVQKVEYLVLTGDQVGKTLSTHEKPLMSPVAAGRWEDQAGEA